MKKTILTTLAVAIAVASSGCSSTPVSPVSQGTSKTQLLTVGASTLIGGVAGAMIDKKHPARGAAIGAAATGLTAAIATTMYKNHQAQRDAELIEQTQRNDRVAFMKADWYNKTETYDPNTEEQKEPQKERIEIEAGTYEGIPFFSRTRVVGSPSTTVFERPRS